jgi:hypothetical protein
MFPGSQSDWTDKLELIHPNSQKIFPIYRFTDRKGSVLNPSEDPQVFDFYSFLYERIQCGIHHINTVYVGGWQ